MQIKIQAVDLKLSPAIEDYLRKRVSALGKFLGKEGKSALLEIEVGKVSGHHRQGEIFRAEINLTMPGRQLRATAEAEDIYAAVDEVKEEMEREIVSAKDKKRTLFRRGALVMKDIIKGFGKWKWKRFPKLPKFPRWRK